jgi:hypothetical protein
VIFGITSSWVSLLITTWLTVAAVWDLLSLNL